MIDCVLSALMAYQFKKLYFGDLRPERICCSKSEGRKIFSIGLPLLMYNTTMYQNFQIDPKTNIYLGPQMLKSYYSHESIAISIEKNDVFSLGLIALEMATLEKMN